MSLSESIFRLVDQLKSWGSLAETQPESWVVRLKVDQWSRKARELIEELELAGHSKLAERVQAYTDELLEIEKGARLRRDDPGCKLTLIDEWVLRARQYLGRLAAALGVLQDAPPPAGESSVGLAPATIPCLPERRHSEDFRSVHWHGRDYAFSAGQAAAVSALWAAFENGTPELAQETILSKAGLESKKLRSVFQVGSEVHPAWGVLIAPGSSKGSYCLLAPAD